MLILLAVVTSAAVSLSSNADAAADPALPVEYSTVPALAATLADPGAAPPGANNWACRSSTHPYPVVLVHGTNVNMLLNWNALAPLLANNGYCVFALDYGGLKFGQIGGEGDIPTSAGELSAFITKVLATTGAAQVDIVGDSEGGMLPQFYVKFLDGGPKVHDLIGLAADSHGSTADGLNHLIDAFARAFPALVGLIDTNAPAIRQQEVGSSFITQLTSVPDTMPGVHYTMIATRYDEIVTPYASQFLTGPDTTNITVQDQCPNDFSEHLALAYDHVALQDVLNTLDPDRASTPTCQTPVLPFIGG